MYAVVGATGNTGRVLCESLLADGKAVRAIGRSKERLRPLVEKGAEAAIASVDDAEAMRRAFSGARGAYCLIPPRFDVEDFRAYQRSVGKSLAAAVKDSGVEYVVSLSSVGAQHQEGTGPIAGLREQEDRLGALAGVNLLHVRAGYFMENLFMSIDTIRRMRVLGTAVRGDVPLPMIAAQDIGRFAAERLAKLDFSGASSCELLGPADVTMQQATRALGQAIGYDDLEYAQFPYSEAEKAMLGMGISPGTASTFIQLYRAINDGLVRAEEERSPHNSTPTTIEAFSREFAQVYGVGA